VGRKKRSFKQESSSKDVPWWKRLYRWTGWRGKTLWDWQALLFVPVTIVLIASLFTQYQTIHQLTIESQRAETERELEEQRAQDAALQTYLEQIGQMLLDKDRPLRQSKEGDEVRTLARARTVTILRRLDSARNRDVLQFLRETGLTPSPEFHNLGGSKNTVIRLDYTNLSEAKLSGANLDSFNLQGTDLSGADLRGAYLAWSVLRETNLQDARLQGANLRGDANLSGDADLSYADLSDANLSEADLSYDNLSSVNLQGANLTDAVLRGANLSSAKVTSEQLAEAKSLQGATMPNGQKYED